MAVPLILTALARNASQPQEAQSLHQAVANDHDGSIFDSLKGYPGNPQSANGAGIWGTSLEANSRLLKQFGSGNWYGPEFFAVVPKQPNNPALDHYFHFQCPPGYQIIDLFGWADTELDSLGVYIE